MKYESVFNVENENYNNWLSNYHKFIEDNSGIAKQKQLLDTETSYINKRLLSTQNQQQQLQQQLEQLQQKQSTGFTSQEQAITELQSIITKNKQQLEVVQQQCQKLDASLQTTKTAAEQLQTQYQKLSTENNTLQQLQFENSNKQTIDKLIAENIIADDNFLYKNLDISTKHRQVLSHILEPLLQSTTTKQTAIAQIKTSAAYLPIIDKPAKSNKQTTVLPSLASLLTHSNYPNLFNNILLADNFEQAMKYRNQIDSSTIIACADGWIVTDNLLTKPQSKSDNALILNRQARIKATTKQIQQLEPKVAALNAEIAQYKNSLLELQAKKSKLTTANNKYSEDLLAKQAQLRNKQMQQNSIQNDINQIQQQIANCVSNITEYQQKLDSLQRQIAKLETELNTSSTKKQQWQRQKLEKKPATATVATKNKIA